MSVLVTVMSNTPDVLTHREVAELLGIDPEAVRSTMRRAGIPEIRGYPTDQVLALERCRRRREEGHPPPATTP